MDEKNRKEFEKQWNSIKKALRRFLKSLERSDHVVDNLMQTTAYRLMRAFPKTDIKDFEAYAITIAKNVFKDYLKELKKQPKWEPLEKETAEDTSDYIDRLSFRLWYNKICEQACKEDPKGYECYALKIDDGLKYWEIAELLKISTSEAERRHKRVGKLLQEKYKELHEPEVS